MGFTHILCRVAGAPAADIFDAIRYRRPEALVRLSIDFVAMNFY